MIREETILTRLDSIEEKILPLAASARAISELKEDLQPRVEEAVRALIVELQDIEADFQLEDLIFFVKKAMRNVRNLTFVLEQMQNLIDFASTAEPMLKVSVPQWISRLDAMEQKGVFTLVRTALNVADKIAETYGREDIEAVGDGLVRLFGLAKKVTSPASLDFMEKLAEIPAKTDLSRAQPVGRWKMLWALSDPELREGLGVALELTKALAVVKHKEVEPQVLSTDNR